MKEKQTRIDKEVNYESCSYYFRSISDSSTTPVSAPVQAQTSQSDTALSMMETHAVIGGKSMMQGNIRHSSFID